MKNRIIALVVGMVLLLFCSLPATLWYVHPDSTLNSIQTALNGCGNYDTVLVAAGTYFENIFWPSTVGILLRSELGADSTVIDGNNSGTVIIIASGVVTTTCIDGFTIRNGYDWLGGGGIACAQSSPIIMNNIISSNSADSAGGGLACINNACPQIISNTIINNSSKEGAGIYCGGYPIIINNIINGNTAALSGGGISCHTFSGTIRRNEISGNSAVKGGGIWIYNSLATIDSCDISNNIGDGIYCSPYGKNPTINYNNIIGNVGYALFNEESTITINAENNWWGDATGPFHPDSNPGGLGDTVSSWVDFVPWLGAPVAVCEGSDQQLAVRREGFLSYPNPFTTATHIKLLGADEKAGHNLCIYDSAGRFVRTLTFPMLQAPRAMQVTWDGRDEAGKVLPPGIYFLKLNGKPVGKVVKVR